MLSPVTVDKFFIVLTHANTQRMRHSSGDIFYGGEPYGERLAISSIKSMSWRSRVMNFSPASSGASWSRRHLLPS
jgi:hypothetical protein